MKYCHFNGKLYPFQSEKVYFFFWLRRFFLSSVNYDQLFPQ